MCGVTTAFGSGKGNGESSIKGAFEWKECGIASSLACFGGLYNFGFTGAIQWRASLRFVQGRGCWYVAMKGVREGWIGCFAVGRIVIDVRLVTICV